MVHHILHNEIDREKWDACVRHSENSLPYGLSWWLDVVSPAWDALVMGDYLAVMPLTARKKFGLRYLYQPFLTQQLGVFYTSENSGSVSDFLDAIPTGYRYIDIQLNSANFVDTDSFQILPRSNFILDLKHDYEVLYSNYHRNCRRNVRKGKLSNLLVREGPGVSVFSRFVEKNIDRSVKDLNPDLYPVMENLMQVCHEKQCSEVVGVYTHGEMVAAGWFVHLKNIDVSKPSRILFMVCASTDEGKKREAMYVLVDHVIAKYAGIHAELDFTGSNIPGVAYFNAGFGARKTTYPAIKRNNLPWWARMMKR